jgi:Holliday junction DNA helicase RuvA
MIGLLRGILNKQGDSTAIIDVNGVGYEVSMPLTDLDSLDDGARLTLYTHLSVREDAFNLYAFTTPGAKQMFRLLTDVSGVGPKAAMNILSAFSTDDLLATLSEGRQDALQRVHGIGKKTAARLCVDLKDKAAKLRRSDRANSVKNMSAERPTVNNTVSSDVASALLNLGYRPAEVEQAITEATGMIDKKQLENFELFLKTTLKILAK